MLLLVFSREVAMLLAKSAPGIAGAGPDCAGVLTFGRVGWVGMIDCVAVPPPEPHGLGLEGSVAEDGFCSGALVGVNHKPEELLVVGV